MISGSLPGGNVYGNIGFDVTYTVGGKRYRDYIPHALVVCAAVDEDCEQDDALLRRKGGEASDRLRG